MPYSTLIRYDFVKLYYKSFKLIYITLLISNWHLASYYIITEFFTLLKEYDYNKKESEIHFKNSKIILNIFDIIYGAQHK